MTKYQGFSKDILIEAIKRMSEDVTFEDIAKEIFSIGLVIEEKIILIDEVLK